MNVMTSPRAGALAMLLELLPVALPVMLVVSACSSAPITGRQRLILISPETEIRLGEEAYAQTLDGVTLSTERAHIDRVTRVGMRLVEAAEVADLKWEFAVIDDDTVVNAWALPGGKVAVYTGILELTEGDDALLATVLAHEIAHVTHRHGAERISRQLGIKLVATALEASMRDRDPSTVNVVMGAFGIGAEVGVALPFGRSQESEADRVGLVYMARAGYDPAKAIEFWKKMSAGADRGGMEFLSTHPSYETRLSDLRVWLREARAEYRPPDR